MSENISYSRYVSRTLLALTKDKVEEIRPLLQSLEIGCTEIDPELMFTSDTVLPMIASGPIFVDLNIRILERGWLHIRKVLETLTARNKIIVVLDEALLDEVTPLLDVPRVEFLIRPITKEDLMQAIQPIDLSERVAEQLRHEGQVDQENFKSEVERISNALAALVETRPAETVKTSGDGEVRSPRESGRLLRKLIQQRRARARFFPAELFADPAWDILLDLAAAKHEGKQVSISSLCIAASVPTTTGLRWIKALTEADLLTREADPEDGRRSFVTLTHRTQAQMQGYLDAVG